MSTVRMHPSGARLEGELTLMGLRDDSVRQMIEIGIRASRRGWSIETCMVAGQPVPVDPENVMAVLAAARHQIRAGVVPEFDGLLRAFTGMYVALRVGSAATAAQDP